jgi:hypothetical protein
MTIRLRDRYSARRRSLHGQRLGVRSAGCSLKEKASTVQRSAHQVLVTERVLLHIRHRVLRNAAARCSSVRWPLTLCIAKQWGRPPRTSHSGLGADGV